MIIVAVIAAGAAPAARRDPGIATVLAGRVAGPAEDCLDPAWAGTPEVIDDHTLLYRPTNGRWWRNDLSAVCPGLDGDSIIVSEMHGSRQCRGDLIHPVDRTSGFSGPFCRLGRFVPYDKPKH